MTTKQWPRLIRDYGQQSRWRDAVNLLLEAQMHTSPAVLGFVVVGGSGNADM